MADSTKPKGELAIRVVAMPADANANGDIFGGWLVSHMDLAGGCQASLRARCRTVTVAINSMNFIKPVSIGDVVCCYTELLTVKTSSMHFKIEVWIQSLKYEQLLKVAEGTFIYVAIDDKGKKQSVDR